MNTAYKALLAGMLAIVFAGPALAHGGGSGAGPNHGGYYGSGIDGGVTVWANSRGQYGWNGAVYYGSPVRHAPAYGLPRTYGHGPQWYHQQGRGVSKAYRIGYRNGRHDARKHRHHRGCHH